MIKQEIANDETANSEWEFSLNSKENSYINLIDANHPGGSNAAVPPSAKPPLTYLNPSLEMTRQQFIEACLNGEDEDEVPF